MAGHTEVWEKDLTEEETEALVEKAAREVHRRGLATPAILMLEMHKPLAGVLGHASVVAAPFAVPFLGFDVFHNYRRLFSNRENIERLLRRIELLCQAPEVGADAQ